jgi:hypothetical protein
VTFALLALGGFLLGGAISVWRNPDRGQRRLVIAVILLVAGVLATVAALLRYLSS